MEDEKEANGDAIKVVSPGLNLWQLNRRDERDGGRGKVSPQAWACEWVEWVSSS